MVPEHPAFSPFKSQKMNPPSPSSITLVHPQRRGASDEVAVPSSVAVANVAHCSVVDEQVSKESVLAVVKIAPMTSAVAVVVVDVVLDGRTTTSPSATVTAPSTFALTGVSSRKLISTACPNFTSSHRMERILIAMVSFTPMTDHTIRLLSKAPSASYNLSTVPLTM
jgi:hypothetical protein